MSVIAYTWKKASQTQLENCIRWCQNRLNLRDWNITLDTNTELPKKFEEITESMDLGRSYIQSDYLTAYIWIPVDKHKESNYNPYQTCVHEMLHVLICGVCGIGTEESESICYRLDPVIYALYCKEHRLKLGQEREDNSD